MCDEQHVWWWWLQMANPVFLGWGGWGLYAYALVNTHNLSTDKYRNRLSCDSQCQLRMSNCLSRIHQSCFLSFKAGLLERSCCFDLPRNNVPLLPQLSQKCLLPSVKIIIVSLINNCVSALTRTIATKHFEQTFSKILWFKGRRWKNFTSNK